MNKQDAAKLRSRWDEDHRHRQTLEQDNKQHKKNLKETKFSNRIAVMSAFIAIIAAFMAWLPTLIKLSQ